MKTTFQNDQALKDFMVAETIKHREADELIKGTYGSEEDGKWRGCAVGCAIKSLNTKLGVDFSTSEHSVLEENGLYPEWLARLEDTIFENLPEPESQTWPERFTKAIPVGVSFQDLEKVKWQFSAYLMKENIERVLTLDIDAKLKEQIIDAIRGVLALNEKAITTGEWDESAADAARSAARSAAFVKHSNELLRLLSEIK